MTLDRKGAVRTKQHSVARGRTSAVSAKGFAHYFGTTTAVASVNLAVAPVEVYGVLDPNGKE